jgi:ABC-type multidrug transport system fused ATPase/permease subunit
MEKKNFEDMKTKGQLNKEEKSEFGDVKGFVYSFYIRNCGICNSVILVLFYLSFIGLKIFSGLWVSYWFSDQFDFKNENWYPIIYLIVIFLAAVSLILRSLSYGHTVSTGSYNLFDSVVTNILRRPLSFFDTTPSGQIMNRCVKDVSDIDFRLPFMFSFFINNFFTIIGSMILLSVISPIHLILILIVFYFVGVTIYKFNKI